MKNYAARCFDAYLVNTIDSFDNIIVQVCLLWCCGVFGIVITIIYPAAAKANLSSTADDTHKGVSAQIITCQAAFHQGSAEEADGISKSKQSAEQLLDFLMSAGDANLILHGHRARCI
eukprot:scaffold17457_cov76-Attheya_sp.AAC.4